MNDIYLSVKAGNLKYNDSNHRWALRYIISLNVTVATISGIFTRSLKLIYMLTFRIEARNTSPEVIIDKTRHLIEISGSSTFKNTSWFYSNVLKWALAFNQQGSANTTINIRLNKIDENSSKWIMLIMRKLSILTPGQAITVNWYYSQNNVNMQINGERLKLNSIIPVNLIAA